MTISLTIIWSIWLFGMITHAKAGRLTRELYTIVIPLIATAISAGVNLLCKPLILYGTFISILCIIVLSISNSLHANQNRVSYKN